VAVVAEAAVEAAEAASAASAAVDLGVVVPAVAGELVD